MYVCVCEACLLWASSRLSFGCRNKKQQQKANNAVKPPFALICTAGSQGWQ